MANQTADDSAPTIESFTVKRRYLTEREVEQLMDAARKLDQGRLHVRRAKRGTPSVHPIRGDEIRALRRLPQKPMCSSASAAGLSAPWASTT